MSATKSKPAGRAVRKEPKVRVRKASIRFNGWDWVADGTGTYVGPLIAITNPPPGLSCAKLKRIVEIAGMDEERLVEIVNATWVTQPQDHPKGNSQARAVLATLGLSTAQGRKGKRS